jgi:hypothetical protein
MQASKQAMQANKLEGIDVMDGNNCYYCIVSIVMQAGHLYGDAAREWCECLRRDGACQMAAHPAHQIVILPKQAKTLDARPSAGE